MELLFGGCIVSWRMPWSLNEVCYSWRMVIFSGCGKILWKIVPYSIMWFIWKERNGRIFNNVSASYCDVSNLVKVRIGKWVMLRKEFKNSNFDSMIPFLPIGKRV